MLWGNIMIINHGSTGVLKLIIITFLTDDINSALSETRKNGINVTVLLSKSNFNYRFVVLLE